MVMNECFSSHVLHSNYSVISLRFIMVKDVYNMFNGLLGVPSDIFLFVFATKLEKICSEFYIKQLNSTLGQLQVTTNLMY